MTETLFTNCRIVLPDEIVAGTVVVRDGAIVEILDGPSVTVALDCGGDYLIPGLIELHTDHLEGHFKPRPRVLWPACR